MKLVINRLFYSLYCFERGIDRFLVQRLKPIEIWIMKIIYSWDPFGTISKNNKSLEKYMANVYGAMNEASENLDYGLCIMSSRASVVFAFVPYLVLLASLAKYWKVFPCFLSFEYILILTFSLSYLSCYFFSFRNEIFKEYFKKFAKAKNNVQWHLITAIVFAGTITSVFLSIILWNK